MLLKPYLPFDAEETVLSWATRLAALHTGGGLIPFLHDLLIDMQQFVVETDTALDRLCELTGEDPAVSDVSTHGTVRHIAERRVSGSS